MTPRKMGPIAVVALVRHPRAARAFAAVIGMTVVLTVAGGASADQVIFLMRHAEQGPPPEMVLTEAGHRRAAALAHRLKDAGITAIFVSDAARTQQTAAPIARALGLTPKVVAQGAIEELVARVRSEHAGQRVLIVNHSLNLPPILKALGHPDPPLIARDDYEPLFVIVPRGAGPPLVVLLRL